MFRRLVVLCLLMGTLAGCGGGNGDMPPGPASTLDAFWLTAPASDAGRPAVLRRARDIDPCALLPRDTLAGFGTVLRIHNTAPSSCTATLNSDETGERTEFDLGVLVRKPGVASHTEDVPVRMVDGVAVSSVRDLDHLVGGQREDQLVERSCTVTAGFGSQLSFMLFVSSPLGAEPCPLGEQVIASALTEMRNPPARGTSPDTARTVVDDAEPCAAATALGVTVPAAGESMWACDFDYRGDQISVSYAYDQEQMATGAPAFTVGSHPVYRIGEPGEDFAMVMGRIGPPIQTSEDVDFMGPRLPTVTVTGQDGAAVDEVVRQSLAGFPA